MSYVDAHFDRERDRINVVERVNGKREYRELPVNYVFYYNDARGKFKTIYGNPVSRFSTRNGKEFHKEVKMHGKHGIWESDINPVFRCLAENYLGVDAPKLNICFFDIEVDFDPVRGYSSPGDPFNAITAISLHLGWLDQLITLAVPPKSLSMESAKDLVKHFPNTFLFEREADLLETFLQLIDDADILSGWNSEGYDIPYCVNRITKVLSKDDTRKFNLWGQYPKKRTFERFGSENVTFDLIGRQHLDYMQLYRKYTYEERHSYSLDAIGEYELDERKTQYEGTLDQLYNQDFVTFIDYSRQDVNLLYRMDQKLKFIDLSNELAHSNTVLLATTMGAVAVTEQAIINHAHEQGLIVPNRKHQDSGLGAAGAYVAYPKKGLHDWIGSLDLNSLYPSVIRALNMGPETIIGQLRPILTDHAVQTARAQKKTFADAWEGQFGSKEYQAVMNMEAGTELTIDWENGDEDIVSAADCWRLMFDSNKPWVLSANGTIFTVEKKGVVPGLLERWYAERKELQAKMRETDGEEREFWDKRQLGEAVNETFPAFMEQAFHCPRKHGEIIASGREVVAEKGLYITKKRYAVLVIDNEGFRTDTEGKPGKVKAMGLDLKRSDTPPIMQQFMSSLLLDVLTGKQSEHIVDRIKEFKYEFHDRPGWEKGTPKRVNNLTMYTAKEQKEGKANMPGHVRAAMNWNYLRKLNNDNYSQTIVDGMKTIVCKLKQNPLGYTSVGYPTDEMHIPQWFKDLPFDHGLMEATIVDKKIDNLLGVLDWDLGEKTQTANEFDSLFSFD